VKFCEHGNETSDFIKHEELLDQLRAVSFSTTLLHGVSWFISNL
jgi:hypothetical protein